MASAQSSDVVLSRHRFAKGREPGSVVGCVERIMGASGICLVVLLVIRVLLVTVLRTDEMEKDKPWSEEGIVVLKYLVRR